MTFLKKIILIVALFPFVLFALDKSDCKIGEMVYIDNFLVEDEKVEIVDTYWGDKNEVKVRHSDGKEEWVLLDDLQGDLGAFVEFVGKEIIKEGMEQVVQQKYQESRTETKRYSMPPSIGDHISVNNNCHKKIEIFISYLPTDSSDWVTTYWYEFEPYKKSILTKNGKRIRTTNTILYFYAKSKDGVWEGDDSLEEIDGETFSMKKLKLTGEKEIKLTCSN